jgi:phosphoribosylanthranilate isomerase
MRTRIKFCGLVEPPDLDCAVALGVDAVGFVFYERSARAVTQQQALSLRRRLPSFVSAVGLFVNAAPHDVRHISDAVGLDVIQFHGDEPLAACLQSVRPGQPWWRAVRMRGPADLLESVGSYQGCEAFLLDAFTDAYGGAGHAFDWSWVAAAGSQAAGHRLIVSGGLTESNVGAAIRALSPFAVDVSSGIQVAGEPRRKDARTMERFVAAVAAADAQSRQ